MPISTSIARSPSVSVLPELTDQSSGVHRCRGGTPKVVSTVEPNAPGTSALSPEWLQFGRDVANKFSEAATKADFEGWLKNVDIPWKTGNLREQDLVPGPDAKRHEYKKTLMFSRDERQGDDDMDLSRKFFLVLIAWGPGQKSPVHDHPRGGCFVRVIKGPGLVEQDYKLDSSDPRLAVPNGPERTFFVDSDKLGYQVGESGLHTIENRHEEQVIFSFHGYFGPCDMKKYEIKGEAICLLRPTRMDSGSFQLVNDTGKAAGGCEGARQRHWRENECRDNVNLDKARVLLAQIKNKFGNHISWGDLMTFAGTVGIKASHGMHNRSPKLSALEVRDTFMPDGLD